MNDKKSLGFIYSATHLKYLREAEQSVISLKQSGNFYPVSIVLPLELKADIENKDVFDQIIIKDDLDSYSAKIDALLNSPYHRTVFLDGDTVIVSSLNELFELLTYFDIAVCPERNASHAIDLKKNGIKLLPEAFHEYNTGVIAIRNSDETQKFLNFWKSLFNQYKEITKIDQVAFRLAVIQSGIRIAALPNEYNFRGITSFQIAIREIKILHERLGGINNTNRSFEELPVVVKKIKKINRYHTKRLVFSFFASVIVIPYNWSPDNFLRSGLKKLKLMQKVRKKDAL